MKKCVLAAGTGTLARGTVMACAVVGTDVVWEPLAVDTATPFLPTNKARGILVEDVELPASGTVTALMFLVGEYRMADLVWPSGIVDAAIATAILELQDHGIILK
jgi:hypothetical protein